MPRLVATLRTLCLALALAVAASCGSSSSDPDRSDVAKPAQQVNIKVTGDVVEPLAQLVQLAVDQDVVLTIESDRSGRLHVHTSPEQYIEFEPGEQVATLSFDRPGVVEVEDHQTDDLVLKVQVR